MRILHTSDWHIGRQLHNVSLLEDQRHMLAQIYDVICAHHVDVVIVAGDIYDRAIPSAAAVELLDETVNHICNDLGRAMIFIAGNHDSAERISFGCRQMTAAGLHMIGPPWKDPVPVLIAGPHGEVAFYGVPYCDPATARHVQGVDLATHEEVMAHLTGKIHDDNVYGRPCVVIAHCFLDGGTSCDSERPLSIGGVAAVSAEHFEGFTYAALGHLHGQQQKSRGHIRYSGSPLKYSFSEQLHQKTVTLVDIDADGQASSRQVQITPLRDMRVIEGFLEDLIERGYQDPNRGDYISARLKDTHAVLEPMAKLRQVYPNILHLDKPDFARRSEEITANRERIKKGEMAMFSDFYQQVTGQEMSEEQSGIVSRTIETLSRAEEDR